MVKSLRWRRDSSNQCGVYAPRESNYGAYDLQESDENFLEAQAVCSYLGAAPSSRIQFVDHVTNSLLELFFRLQLREHSRLLLVRATQSDEVLRES